MESPEKDREMNFIEFDRIWSAVYGHPAWSVRKGHGSFLTLEFGSPTLHIREPRTALPNASEKVRELAARRLVTVTGNWHLWIYCCSWSIELSGKEAAHSESPGDDITFAAERLDGQKLLSVGYGTMPSSWMFAFDLGGVLKTWPYDEDPSDEQWLLYERDSGDVLSVRADGLCSYGSGSRPPKIKSGTECKSLAKRLIRDLPAFEWPHPKSAAVRYGSIAGPQIRFPTSCVFFVAHFGHCPPE